MPELNWRFGYPYALGLMVLTTLGMLWWFKHKGWLGHFGEQTPQSDSDKRS
jgi:hypothetical protein